MSGELLERLVHTFWADGAILEDRQQTSTMGGRDELHEAGTHVAEVELLLQSCRLVIERAGIGRLDYSSHHDGHDLQPFIRSRKRPASSPGRARLPESRSLAATLRQRAPRVEIQP